MPSSPRPVDLPGPADIDPDHVDAEPAPAGPPARAGLLAVLPGALVAIVVSAGGLLLSRVLPSVSALLVAVVVGVVARTLGLVPAAVEPGLAWTARRVLRTGVVLLGLQLSVGDLLDLGPREVGVLLTTVAVTFASTLWLGPRLRVSRALTLLVATGFSICGAAAVAAMSPVADAEEEDVATAVALVTLYGSIAIAVVPVLSGLLGLTDRTAGLWAGLAVHEVAQVVAAAGAVSAAALAVAVVAKLGRVVLLAPLVAGVSLVRRRSTTVGSARPPVLPLFVVGFLAAVALRTTGAFPDAALTPVKTVTTVALGAAMLALGTQVRIAGLVRTGGRALALGGVATLVAMSVSLGGLLLVS
ncbi:YeiH family protein [Cellulomonas hominis]